MNEMTPPSVDAEMPAQSQPEAIKVADAPENVAPTGCFQLLRAFMVDSLAKGTRQIFELEGGTVITGVNGRGKTSILQMLLLFYGSNPNKLVSKGKSSFIEYYLPNTSSYLAFEYRVQDGSKRLMIAYANTTGDKVFYRFVRQGYDPKIFVTDDGYFVESKHLKMRLTELNIPHAQHQIDTYADYRAVIQYCVPATLDRKQRDQLKATVQRLGEELLRLRQQPEAPGATGVPEVDGRLQEELETLRESLEEERAKLSRTLVEKEFIEQVFIDTDAVTDSYQALQQEHAALQEQLQALQARLEATQSR